MKTIKTLSKFVLGLALATLFTMTAFAATKGWIVNESKNEWQYLDNYGEPVTCEWKKSGDDMYYLGEDGFMSRNAIVEADEAYRGVDADGKMIKNVWIKTTIGDDEEARWMYFQANGKSVTAGWKTINSKNYHFTDNKMNYGFLSEDGAMLEDADNVWASAVYYCGSEDDGARHTGWLKVDDVNGTSDAWVYFGSNGKKYADTTKVINGNKYRFDENGKMVTEWYATPSTATATNYFNEDGTMKKAGWVYTTAKDDESGDQFWFYAKNNGELYKDIVAKINNKYYAFDSEGKMLTGFVKVDENKTIGGSTHYMYFTENDDPNLQGPAITGKSVVEHDGEKATILFNSRGLAEIDGPQVKKGYFYINSVLQAKDDADKKYEVVEINGTNYIWTVKTGKMSTKGSFVDNDNDVKYVIKDNVVTEYIRKDNKWVIK